MGDREELDWSNLPPGADPVSLWTCLHDGKLQALRSDLMSRTLIAEVDVAYLRDYHGLADGFRFLWRFADVASVRATSYAIWPGEFDLPPGTSYDEQNRLTAEYQSKWRQQSVSWDELEAALQDDEICLDILDAELVEGEGGVAVRWEGTLDSDAWHALIIRARSVTLSGTDGRALTLDRVIGLGDEYWAAFGKRSDG